MTVRLVADGDTTITLGWDPVPGQWGYVPTIDGSEVLTDGRRHIGRGGLTSVKIGKVRDGEPHRYGVNVLTLGAKGDTLGRPAGPPPVPTPKPPPPTGAFEVDARKIGFAADHALAGSELPRTFKIAYSADPFYEGGEPQDFHSMRSIVDTQAAEGRPAQYAWGNQSQIGISTIKAFRVKYGLDGEVYQAETAGELADIGVEADGHLRSGSLIDSEPVTLIGNPGAWTQDQRAGAAMLVAGHRLQVIFETYVNLGGQWPETASSQGVPTASECLGLYDGSGEKPGVGRYVSVDEYHAHTPDVIWHDACVYHVGGARPGDLRKLAA